MKETALFVSWRQVPRGREAKAFEVFKKAHDFLKKQNEGGKIKEISVQKS